MTRKLGLLTVAMALGVMGSMAVFSYVNKVEAEVNRGAEMVDVLVAAARIPEGTTPAAAQASDLVQVAAMPRKSVPEGALTTLNDVGANQSTTSDMFAGEVLLRAKFADRTARTGALVIPNGKIALSVQLGDPQRVAGFVVPGSEVAVFLTGRHGPSGGTQVEAAEYTSLLLPRTSVIAVGPATLKSATQDEKEDDQKGADVVPSAILTLALTQEEAERLVHATQTGSLYFGLLSATSTTKPGPGVSNLTLLK